MSSGGRLGLFGGLLGAILVGCQSKPPQPTIAESFEQLKRGAQQEEVVALLGEPHARSDGPQVATSDRDPTLGKSVLTPDGRYIEAKDAPTRAVVAFIQSGMPTNIKEPAAFQSGSAVTPQSGAVHWLYRPDLGRRRSGNVQDKSLILLSFSDGQLSDAILLSH
jgi:hypothetical protein